MIDQAGIQMAQGSSIACERIGGVNDNMFKSHYHNYYEIYYLEEGERYHMLQDNLYPLSPGQLILFSPYIMHRSYGEENIPFKRIVLYFQREEIASQELLELLDQGNGVYRPELRVQVLLHRILETLLEQTDISSGLQQGYRPTLLNLLLYTMIFQTQKLAMNTGGQQSRMSQVISYIHNHYQEELCLEQLARKFYISPYYLCREFKHYTNSTVIQYINITRIMNAQRKFMETDKNITQISKETGFSNITHFNRVFKMVTGMTPSSYRKTHRNVMGEIRYSSHHDESPR